MRGPKAWNYATNRIPATIQVPATDSNTGLPTDRLVPTDIACPSPFDASSPITYLDSSLGGTPPLDLAVPACESVQSAAKRSAIIWAGITLVEIVVAAIAYRWYKERERRTMESPLA
jgi:hypothetical protein